MKCLATIKTAGNHLISLTTRHTHEGNVATSRARTAGGLHQMKQKITENVSGLSVCRLSRRKKGDENAAYAPCGVWHFYLI